MPWNSKKYARINWKNRPSTATALGATNLNKMDVFLNEVDNYLITMEASKLNIETANGMLQTLEIDVESGKIKATELGGTTHEWDLNLEKIPVSFTLQEDGTLVMTTDDGTEFEVNLVELIQPYEFDDSDTIGFTEEFRPDAPEEEIQPTTKGAFHVTAIVKEGSIEGKHLNPDYREEIQQLKNDAETAASSSLQYSKDSKRWAIGDEEYPGSERDNSKFYSEESRRQYEAAKLEAEKAATYSQIVAPEFYLDPETMALYKKGGVGVDFVVTDDKELCWRISA